MPARQRLTFAAIAALIAVVAVVVLVASGGSDDSGGGGSTNASTEAERQATPAATAVQEEAEPQPTSTPRPARKKPPRIVVRDGEPVGGVRELEVSEGDRVRFTVSSDVADHVHVHGYDLMRDVGPGQNATFSFKASITGIFEAELEDRGVQVASLRVDP